MVTRLLFILLVSVQVISAQPVANNPFIPVSGHEYSVGSFYYSEPFLNQRKMNDTGENIFWNLSSISVPYSTVTYTTDKDPKYGSLFPGANYTWKTTGQQNDEGYRYYYFGADSTGYYGYSTFHPKFEIRAPHLDPNVHIHYPVRYKDSFTDYGYFEFIGIDKTKTTNDSQLCISIYISDVKVDAWGSMQLKTRTIDSVLKINVNTMHIRRWYYDMGTIAYKNDTVYERYIYFISPQLQGPFLSGKSDFGGYGINFTFQNDIFLSIPQPGTKHFTIYPNPARSYITVNLSGMNATHYYITDLFGRKTTGELLNGSTITIEGLSTGIYFLHLYDGDNYLGCEKFCKE